MKSKQLLNISAKPLFIVIVICTFNGNIYCRKMPTLEEDNLAIARANKHEYDDDSPLEIIHNMRNKLNMKISDQWMSQWEPYVRDGEDLPLAAFIGSNIANYAQFGVSKPKPWRNDDPTARTRNTQAEVAVNPVKLKKMPLPEVSKRRKSPAVDLINKEGCGVSEVKKARVVNGKDALEGAYPWMVALLKNGDSWCGGTIINERWVVTAGHCFMIDPRPRLYAVRVGTIDRNRGTTYKVDKVVVHERFHLDNMFNSDIALIHLNRDIQMSKLVRPVCISRKRYEEPRSNKLLVVGWGQTSYENKELPTILQEVLLDTIKIDECAKKYKKKGNTIYYSQICTWNKGQDACQGDSGAPAIEYRNEVAYLIGIVSYGSTCADEMPGVYTKVSYFYDWILRTLAKEEGLADDESETGD